MVLLCLDLLFSASKLFNLNFSQQLTFKLFAHLIHTKKLERPLFGSIHLSNICLRLIDSK